MSLIRTQLLKAYYDGDGKYDPVVISLPTPERGSPAQISSAMHHLKNVDREVPDHPEVTLGYIEVWGAMLMLGAIDVHPDWREAYIGGAPSSLEQIEKRSGASWRTHSLRALLRYAIATERRRKRSSRRR